MTTPDTGRGLYPKYRVEKINGKPVGECFVLEEHDPHAIAALRAYAESCCTEFQSLATDLVLMAERWEETTDPVDAHRALQKAARELAHHADNGTSANYFASIDRLEEKLRDVRSLPTNETRDIDPMDCVLCGYVLNCDGQCEPKPRRPASGEYMGFGHTGGGKR